MKKILISLIALCCLFGVSQAQVRPISQMSYPEYYKLEHPNEISLGYGVSLIGASFSKIINYASLISDLGEGDVQVRNAGTRGWITLGYTYQLNRVISVGLNVGYYNVGITLKDDTGTVNSSAGLVPILATGKFDWFRNQSDMFGMYSKVGLGAMAWGGKLLEDDLISRTYWTPAFHVSLIGLEVGQAVSGFMELGAGMEGIFQIGIRGRF